MQNSLSLQSKNWGQIYIKNSIWDLQCTSEVLNHPLLPHFTFIPKWSRVCNLDFPQMELYVQSTEPDQRDFEVKNVQYGESDGPFTCTDPLLLQCMWLYLSIYTCIYGLHIFKHTGRAGFFYYTNFLFFKLYPFLILGQAVLMPKPF